MSFTVPNYWKYSAKGNGDETWLIQLGYGTSTAFLGISTADILIDSVQYYGIIEDITGIVEKIDLTDSSSSIGNIQISCVNKLKSGNLTDVFFTGVAATEYLNREVKIYSRMGDTTALSNCTQIYSGYLKKIAATDAHVELSIEQHLPWRDISIPNVTSDSGKWQPVAYGNFAANTEDALQNKKRFYPVPFEREEEGNLYFVVSDSDSARTNCIAHHYDKNLDIFIRIKNLTSTSFSDGDVYLAGFTNKMERGFLWYVTAVNSSDAGDWINPTNALSSTGTYATFGSQLSDGDSETGDLILNIPRPTDGAITASVEVTGYMKLQSPSAGWGGSGENIVVTLYHVDNGTPDTMDLITYDADWAGDPTTVNFDANTDDAVDTYDKDFVTITLRAEGDASPAQGGGADNIGYEIGVSTCWIEGTVELDSLTDDEARNILDGIDEIYMSGGSLEESYTDGTTTNVIADIHKAHRDILARFGGFDYSDANMDGWSALNTARTDWYIHYWISEPEPISKVLEKLQYEGCFVFVPTFSGGRYIYVKDSYSSGDVAATLTTEDIGIETIETTDINDMITATSYNYNKNAANGKYESTANESVTAARTAYFKSVGTNENIKTVNLDALTGPINDGTTANESIARYYENINATPKILVTAEIVNRSLFDLQIGDIVKFSLDKNPFSKTWSSLYFMIVESRRTIGKMNIVAREVG